MSNFQHAFYHSLLWHFCDKYVGRYAIFAPFREGNTVYATDARRCIAIDADTCGGCPDWSTDIETTKRPNCQQMLDSWNWNVDFVPLGRVSRRVTIEAGEEGDYDIDELSYYDEIAVGTSLFQRDYIYFVSLIPNVVVHVTQQYLLFKFEHGRGVVMAIHKDVPK